MADLTRAEEESNIVVVDVKNLDEVITRAKYVLIEFYAPWCSHCTSMVPDYEKAALVLKSKGSDIVLAKCDATVNIELAREFGIIGFPTMKMFMEGKRNDYVEVHTDRTTVGIVTEIERIIDPNFVEPLSSVVNLTSANFHDFVDQHDMSVVEFYAPWCGHCQRLVPEYERAAVILKEKNIPLAKIDAAAERKIAEEYKIGGYPTILFFRKGQQFEVKNARDYESIVDKVIDFTKPPSMHVKSLRDLKSYIEMLDQTVVGVLDSPDSEFAKHFFEASFSLRSITVYHTFDPKAVEALNVKAIPSVSHFIPERFYSEYDAPVRTMTEISDPQDVVDFAETYNIPLLGEYKTEGRYDKIRPLLVMFYNVDFFELDSQTQFWRHKLIPVAHQLKSQITMAVGNDERCSKDLDSAGLGRTGNEFSVIIFGKDGKLYPLEYDEDDTEFSIELLEEFAMKYLAGLAKPFMRSELPPKMSSGPIKIVVGKTFDKLVEDNPKDVILYLWDSEHCTKCDDPEREFTKFAKALAYDPNLFIGKMDVSKNDYNEKYKAVEHNGPTIWFKATGEGIDPIRYNREPEVMALGTFLKEKRYDVQQTCTADDCVKGLN